jgi:lysophospholipase L1-like esterase
MKPERHAPYILAGVAIGFLLTSAVSIAYIHWWLPSPASEYIRNRSVHLVSQAQAAGKADTLVLGDSIVEENALDDLCGRTFAAGIGGATVADLAKIAPALVAATHPRRIVLALGTNDVLRRIGEGSPFRERYLSLLASLSVKPFALVGVANGQNDFIRRTASTIGATYVPPIVPALTSDGIHPTLPGRKLWKARVARACPRP